MKENQTTNAVVNGSQGDASFESVTERMNLRFTEIVNSGINPVFQTNAEDLFDAYLASFPTEEERQHHNCHACRTFINRFGGLVVIDDRGTTTPVMWDHAIVEDSIMRNAFEKMSRIVRRASVTGVFLSKEDVWGEPVTGEWRHFFVTPTSLMQHKHPLQTAGQSMAEKKEDFKNVVLALTKYPLGVLDQALGLLKSDSLFRSEKVLGQAQWLRDLRASVDSTRSQRAKESLVWRAVAIAPAGFCHPRSSMIGTLLDDIVSGMEFASVERRFRDKMNPLDYQRPKAPPAAGAVAEAEKIVARLNAAGSLRRRFARLEEIQSLWIPKMNPKEDPKSGVFGHIETKEKGSALSSITAPPKNITWVKFHETVLSSADSIDIKVPSRGPFSSLVTAVEAEAPPILQWDSEHLRNPFSWYLWANGSYASQFGIDASEFQKVNAITLQPSMWNGGFEHQGAGVLFVIDGAKETRVAGNCLFPEILKSEFHAVRSVIESYSRSAELEGLGESSVAGLMLQKSADEWNGNVIRVRSGGVTTFYNLDRWD